MIYQKMKLLVVCALLVTSSSAALAQEPCGETDLACLQRALLTEAEKAASISRQLAGQTEIAEIRKSQIGELTSQNEMLNNALKESMSLSTRKWYESPWLWVVVGVVVGGAAVAVGGWAIGQAANAHH